MFKDVHIRSGLLPRALGSNPTLFYANNPRPVGQRLFVWRTSVGFDLRCGGGLCRGENVPPARFLTPLPFESPSWYAKKNDRHTGGRSFLADRVGFEPTSLLRDYLISSQGRYDHFDTCPYRCCVIIPNARGKIKSGFARKFIYNLHLYLYNNIDKIIFCAILSSDYTRKVSL